MKDKILVFIIGVLLGAVVATSVFFIYEKNNSGSQTNESQNIQMRDGETPPEMPNGERPDGETPPEMPNGERPDGETPPDKPEGEDNDGNSQEKTTGNKALNQNKTKNKSN